MEQILALLIQERDRLNKTIEVLLDLPNDPGRSPRSVVATVASVVAAGKRKRMFTPALREKQAERMKAYWAAKRKQESGKKA
jgi:hypothetical protein